MGILVKIVCGKNNSFKPGFGNVVWGDGSMACRMPLAKLWTFLKMTNSGTDKGSSSMKTEAAKMEVDPQTGLIPEKKRKAARAMGNASIATRKMAASGQCTHSTHSTHGTHSTHKHERT